MVMSVQSASSSGGGIDPTVGLHVPDPQLIMEANSIGYWGDAIRRQNQTLYNAELSYNRKQQIVKKHLYGKLPGVKRTVLDKMLGRTNVDVLNKRIAQIEKQMLKADGKERETLAKDRDALAQKVQGLQTNIQEEQKSDKKVLELREQSHTLNAINHRASFLLAMTAPQHGGYLNQYIGQTDLLSKDRESSASVFIPPTGFFGFNLMGGGGFVGQG